MWLLIFVPVTIGLEELAPERYLLIFITSSLAILPLARWMGDATEQLATHFGEGVGGLLNATFGNAAELIIALAALRAGLHDVVKASIVGSIIGNVLLVLVRRCWPEDCGTRNSALTRSRRVPRQRCLCSRQSR